MASSCPPFFLKAWSANYKKKKNLIKDWAERCEKAAEVQTKTLKHLLKTHITLY